MEPLYRSLYRDSKRTYRQSLGKPGNQHVFARHRVLFISHYLAKSKPDLNGSSDMISPTTELRSQSFSRQLTPTHSISPEKLYRHINHGETHYEERGHTPLKRKDSSNFLRRRISLMKQSSNSPLKSDMIPLQKTHSAKKSKKKLDGILHKCMQLSQDIKETQFENRRSHSQLSRNIKELSHFTFKVEQTAL